MSDNCIPCGDSALESALIAADLAALDAETTRVETIIHDQACRIKHLEEENCKLERCLSNCEKDKQIILERTRSTLGKLRGIRAVCR